ncbi:hypothetical protein C8J57DRAFT_1403041 [Mycena rebaudengoi]|nr:hypothetical protein C8J57DRAFT_1403041 [Mycena rebaudengoi]
MSAGAASGVVTVKGVGAESPAVLEHMCFKGEPGSVSRRRDDDAPSMEVSSAKVTPIDAAFAIARLRARTGSSSSARTGAAFFLPFPLAGLPTTTLGSSSSLRAGSSTAFFLPLPLALARGFATTAGVGVRGGKSSFEGGVEGRAACGVGVAPSVLMDAWEVSLSQPSGSAVWLGAGLV